MELTNILIILAVILLLVIIIIILLLIIFLNLGNFLNVNEDPVISDVIVVLSGDNLPRTDYGVM